MRKNICIFITFLLIPLLAACSNKGDDKKITHYKEINIKLPDSTGVIYDMTVSAKGNISILADTNNGMGRVFELNKKDQSWKEKNKPWEGLSNSVMFEAKFIKGGKNYASVLYNALLVKSEEEANQLQPKYFIIKEDGSNKEITLDLSDGDKFSRGNLFHCMLKRRETMLGIDNAGIIYCFSYDGALQYVNSEVRNTDSSVVKMLDIQNKIYVILDNGKVYCMDADSGKETDGDEELIDYLKYVQGDYEAYVDVSSDKIYKLNEQKIYSYSLDKKKTELVLDMKYYDLKNGNSFQMIASENGTLYITYTLATGEAKLNKYEYVKEGIEIKREVFKVYSLTDDNNLQSLIDAFNVKYPEVPVEIEFGYTDDNGKTETDALKLLNTELLAGKGPDIMVMDGLPVETYHKEGMLKDINSIVDKDILKKDLFENMLMPYNSNGVQYAVPSGFYVYGIVGKQELVDAFDDTNRFLSLAESQNRDFAVSDYNLSEAANIMYIQDIPKCFLETGNLDSGRLMEFYTNIGRLYKLSGNSFGEDNKQEALSGLPETTSIDTSVEWIYYDHLPFVTAPYLNRDSFPAVKYLVSKKGYAQKYVQNEGKLVYKDKLILGVLNKSTNDKDVKRFIEFVLNEGQESISQNSMALPIKQSVLRSALVKNDQKPYKISEFGFGDKPKMTDINGIWLDDKEYKSLAKKLSSAVRVRYTDSEIENAIMAEARAYCLGEKSLEEASKEAEKKIALYNEE